MIQYCHNLLLAAFSRESYWNPQASLSGSNGGNIPIADISSCLTITVIKADLHYTLQNPLPKYDTDDEIALYHRFKVTVQNPSGLLNIEEQVITIQMAIYFALTYVLQIVRSTVPQN